MGHTDRVVGTGMLSFITLGGDAVTEDRPVDPKEPAEEPPTEQPTDGARQEQPPAPGGGQPPAEKQ